MSGSCGTSGDERIFIGGAKPVLLRVRDEVGTADPACDPTLVELQHEFGEDVRLLSLRRDELPGLAAWSDLDPPPGLLLIRGGRIVDGFVGTPPKRLLVARLRALLEAA